MAERSERASYSTPGSDEHNIIIWCEILRTFTLWTQAAGSIRRDMLRMYDTNILLGLPKV
eukprot:scaffold69486_cov57-Attheya_sp.AAC.10